MSLKARTVALDILLAVEKESAYSNVALDLAFEKNNLNMQDKNLATELVYGTLTHYQLLEFWLKPYHKKKLKDWLELLLMMTLYQLYFLERVPDYAAINEAVEIAKKRGGGFNGRLTNGILRNVTKNPLNDLDQLEPGTSRLAIEYSHPEWLIKLWNAQFGEAKTTAMLKANLKKAPRALRVNLLKTTPENLQQQLKEEGVATVPGKLAASALIATTGNPLATQAFKDGLFYIQDEASMLVGLAMSPPAGSEVLDVCAAPGGKSLHLSQMVGHDGVVYAHDLYDHKITRLKANMQRLGVTNIKPSVLSAFDLEAAYETERFDYILVDAPCSGLGIVRRHPEAKLLKQPEDLDELTELSRDILDSASKLLRPNGRIVYSTCTVNRKENHRQIDRFLKENQNFKIDASFAGRMPSVLKDNFEDGMLQLLPQNFDTDGFFIAVLERTK